VHAEVSWQAVIRNFDSTRQATILQTKLRDLELAELRMARPLAPLADGYRTALADYLGQSRRAAPVTPFSKHSWSGPSKASVRETLAKLDELDAERRAVESSIKPDTMRP
jgi:hypothetical protein